MVEARRAPSLPWKPTRIDVIQKASGSFTILGLLQYNSE
jgi:hypothetical protein